jgi:hypothetical protein
MLKSLNVEKDRFEIASPSSIQCAAFNVRTLRMPRLALVSLLAILFGGTPETVWAQVCGIDWCQSSCSGYALGSFSKSACVDRCMQSCQKKASSTWGAIAYSKKDKAAGWSFEKSDKVTAERIAMQECNKQGGVKCAIEASFSGSCGAVAADGELVGWGTDAAKSGAERRAMAECSKQGAKKCAIEASICSVPGASSAPRSMPAPPKAVAWGAIAYSAKDMGAGWSQGKADRASAEREAMAACSQRGKACVLQTAFNKTCGALAADRNFTGSATSTDQREALQKAVDECKKAGGTNCVPHIAFCSN